MNEETSVDQLHELIDNLFLTVFESMRQAPTNNTDVNGSIAEGKAAGQKVMQEYQKCVKCISSLGGIDLSEDELDKQIEQLSMECVSRSENVSSLYKQLLKIQNDTQEQFSKIASDQALGLSIEDSDR